MVSAIVFDLDGVLIEPHSSWERLHEYFGVDEKKRKENMSRYFSKEIDYGQWIREDVSLWKRNGHFPHKSEVENALKNYVFIDGARECVQILKENGLKLFIVSAGIDLLAQNAGRILDIYDIWANGFEYDEKEYLTGKDVCRVDLLRKDVVMNQIIEKYNFKKKDILSVGDSKYDIPMFKASGVSIAFDPKNEEVKKEADITICERNLLRIIDYIEL